jgi:crotonobetainyl-CoA:carnitine CoA-transferase CaiB-like acyl-CoA transferase
LSNIFATKDGQWLTIVGTSGATYRRIFDAIGRADLLDGDRLASSASRLQHSNEVDGIVADWCLSLPLAEIQDILTRHEVPHSKVYSIEDVVADPHVQARNALIQLPDPDLGHLDAPCVVPRFSNHTPVTPRSGPGVGEHNEEVFGEIGVGTAELARLKSLGVV